MIITDERQQIQKMIEIFGQQNPNILIKSSNRKDTVLFNKDELNKTVKNKSMEKYFTKYDNNLSPKDVLQYLIYNMKQ